MTQLKPKEVPMKYIELAPAIALLAVSIALPQFAHASVESSLSSAQGKLTHIILPVCSVIGIAWAAFSFLSGNEKAKTHIWYALIGSAIGFGAQSIVDFISQTVR
jgi:hypothetical protein